MLKAGQLTTFWILLIVVSLLVFYQLNKGRKCLFPPSKRCGNVYLFYSISIMFKECVIPSLFDKLYTIQISLAGSMQTCAPWGIFSSGSLQQGEQRVFHCAFQCLRWHRQDASSSLCHASEVKKPVMWPYFYCISGNLQCIINVFAYSGSAPMDGVQLTVSDIPGASLGQRSPK